MRKGLFAIVLVAASFAGGATVNGPGLRWVRDIILNQPGAEIATTTLGDPPPESEPSSGAGAAPVAEIPSTPIPPLVIPPEPQTPASSSPSVAAKADSVPPWPPAPAPPRSRTSEPPEKPPGVKPLTASAPNTVASPPAFEPPAPLSTSKDHDPGATPPHPIAIAAPVDLDVNLAALPPDSGPPRLETRPDASPSSSPTPGARVLDDWGTIRRKMHALGVARYGIEGEPEGRVRFHCIIPLAGRRAVGQQFEAEGDNEIEAAQTALRRVALWRATEHPTTAPAPAPAPAP